MRPFILFGPAHLATLLGLALASGALVRCVRQHPASAERVARGLAALLAVAAVTVLVLQRREGVPWSSLAPLQLCDVAIPVAVWALLTRHPLACELAYFWGCAGTVLALLTPDLSEGFPHPHFVAYFALHGGVVLAAVLLVAGLGCAPRPGAAWRAFLWTNAYAAVVAAVNVAFGTNFLYLRAKPTTPTPLDWFGPWPVYLVVGEAVALALFTLLALPFRRAGTRRNVPP